MSEEWDVIVVGAGPAGMAAATRLAQGGASVVLLDEHAAPGGQIYRGIEANVQRPSLSKILGKDYFRGRELLATLKGSGAHVCLSTAVWQLETNGTVWTRGANGIAQMRAKHLVLATGAMERPVPVEGWTLPGVMTVGALQILLKSGGVVPRCRLVLAGSGPLFYLYAAQALEAEARDVVLLDTASASLSFATAPLLPSALTGQGWRYLVKGLALIAKIKRARLRWLRAASEIAIEGEGRAERVVFRHRGRINSVTADLVGLHEGVIPHLHVARSLGLSERWDESQHAFVPLLDACGRSSLDSVHVAGDAGGIAGARAAEHSGRIAALAILGALNRCEPGALDRETRRECKTRTAHLTVRPLLEGLYPPPESVCLPADAVTVCRCESVTAGEVRHAVADGAPGPNQVKAFLRCGMGPCQGRLCGPTVSAIIAAETGRRMEETGHYRIRPPLKPITLGELAQAAAIVRETEKGNA